MLSGKTCKLADNLKILIDEDDDSSSTYLSILAEEFSSEILLANNGFVLLNFIKQSQYRFNFNGYAIALFKRYEVISQICQ